MEKDSELEGKPTPDELPNTTSALVTSSPSRNAVSVSPSQMTGFKPGLELLEGLEHLFIQQIVDIGEVNIGFEANNKYELMNADGQRLYLACGNSSCCKRTCLGKNRPFRLFVMDHKGRQIVKLTRPSSCALFWWGGNLCGKLTVENAEGELLGTIRQKINPCTATYEVLNSEGQCILTAYGPSRHLCCPLCMSEMDEFKIYSAENTSYPIASVKMHWGGILVEPLTTAEKFSIQFNPALDVNTKATLIGLGFLIDGQFFEKLHRRTSNITGCNIFIVIASIVIVSLIVFVLTKKF